MPGVDVGRARETRVAIRGRGDDLVTNVIQCLAKHRSGHDFRTETPTLEDVFLKPDRPLDSR